MGPLSFGFSRQLAAEKAEKERLRREDHLRVKHDKLFSDWKILVGPSNWKDHAAGEEGSQRYNIHNLPATYFGPGVYELGLTQNTYVASQSTNQRKIRRHSVLVVYLGQADNVRQRLQRYGQSGSHLEGKRSASEPTIQDIGFKQQQALQSVYRQAEKRGMAPAPEMGIKQASSEDGLHLFTEVFSHGYSIAFRWARTESKQVAEKVEAELLHVFDYPWNSALNGARRPRDILTKLELLQYHLESNICLGKAVGVGWRKWEYLSRNVGIPVAVRKPMEEGSSNCPRPRRKFFIFVTSSSDSASKRENGAKDSSPVCGALLEDGSSCHSPAVRGRRRCSDHKGRRVKVSTKQSRSRPVKSKIVRVKKSVSVVTIRAQGTGKRVEIADVSTEVICGAILDGGSICLNLPVEGRKRCSDHKGIHVSRSKLRPKMVPTHLKVSAPSRKSRPGRHNL